MDEAERMSMAVAKVEIARLKMRDLTLQDGDAETAAAWLNEHDIVRLGHGDATALNWHAGKRGLYLEEGDEGEWHVKKL